MSEQVIALLKTLNSKYLGAIDFHRNMSDIYAFLALPGYCTWHQFQLFDESLMQRKVKKFIIDNYNMPIVDEHTANVSLFADYTSRLTRDKIPANKRLDIIKATWVTDYLPWESVALSAYEDIAKNLFEAGDMLAFGFVMQIVSDVGEELARVRGKVLELQGHEFDLAEISSDQGSLAEEYKEKLNELRLGDGLV